MKTFWLKYQYFPSLFSIFKVVKKNEIILSCLKLFKSFLLKNVQNKTNFYYFIFFKTPEINNLLEVPLLEILNYFVSLSFLKKNLFFSIIFEIIKIVSQIKVKNLKQTMVFFSISKKAILFLSRTNFSKILPHLK